MAEVATLAGKYQTVRRLAVGGMGEIYLARESGLLGFSRLVVIKRLLPQYASDRYFVEMFVDEARIIGNLHHPNICQILELGDEDGTPFLVLEYVRGESLSGIWDRAHQRKEEISRVITLRVLADAAWGLHFAHEARDADDNPLNVIHRDISPHNVMVSFHGDVKLMDFGIARADNRQHRTDTGKIKGKISYMSPEQLRGMPLDRRTDVFAVGVMLWELTLNRRLFGGGSEVETLQKATACVVPPPRSIDPSYPADLEAIVMNALAADRDHRTATAGELAAALAEQVSFLGGCERGDVAAVLRSLFPVESVMAEDIPTSPSSGKGDTAIETWRQAKHEFHARPTAPLHAPDPDAERAPRTFDIAHADFRPTAPLRSEKPPAANDARPTAPLRAEGGAVSASELRPTTPLHAESATPAVAPRRRRYLGWLLAAIVVVSGAGIAIAFAIRPEAEDAAVHAQAEAPPVAPRVAAAAVPDAQLPSPPTITAPVTPTPQPAPTAIPTRSPPPRARSKHEAKTPAEVPPKADAVPPPAHSAEDVEKPTSGSLAVSSARVGVVFIDGERKKSTPFQMQLPAGEHDIALELAEGAGTLRARPRIESGKKTKCRVENDELACAVAGP